MVAVPESCMDALTVTATTHRGMPAWSISGSALEVVVTVTGAHLAVLRSRGDQLNPLWQPQWPAVDPSGVAPGGPYGGSESSLLATIVGHNLCLDRFGPPWPGENRPVHGEAPCVAWSLAQPAPDLVELSATLPLAKLRVRRRIRMQGTTAQYSAGVAHDGALPRAVEWCEHATVGDPFLDGAVFTAGIDGVWNWPHAAEPGSRFAGIPPEGAIAVDEALAMPAPGAAPCGDVLCAGVASGWWTATNVRLKRRLTYRWEARQFPWLALWTQHRSRTGGPWNGRERTRGMELSTKPFPEGKPPASREQEYRGRSAQCLVPPGAWLDHPVSIAWEAT